MQTSKKIIAPLAILFVATVATYFLAPLKAWKNGSIITRRKQTSSDSVETTELTYSPLTCNYAAYCKAYWQSYLGTQVEYNDENHTYQGGVLNEITITPE